jgi:choline dehydrogenase-like flavoprotein
VIRDSQSIPADAELECDLCIVGAGAAGITLALQFAHSKLNVIVLESGGDKFEPERQALNYGDVVDGVHAPAHLYRHRRLGGSTTIWGGRCVPLDELDFHKRTHVPLSGWPFDRSTLRPFYERAQDLVEAGAFDYCAATALPGDELVEGFHDAEVLAASIERFSPPTNFWKRYRAELAGSTAISVIKHATGLRLEGARRVSRIACAGRGDLRFTVRARVFVLAVGGLETVRLLGHSGYGNHSGLLGRTYMCHIEAALGQIRLSPAVRGVQFGFARTADGIYCRTRFTLRPERQQALGILNGAVRLGHANVVDPAHRHSVLSAMYLAKRLIIPEYARKFTIIEHEAMRGLRNDARLWLGHVRNVLLGAPLLAGFMVHWVRRRHFAYRRIPYVALRSRAGLYTLDFGGEQAPNPDSRVWLGNATDRYGMPRLKIDWRSSELDRRTLVQMLRELRRALEASGCGTVEFDQKRLEEEAGAGIMPTGGHHIGTARMSEDAGTGVVDPDVRVHHVDNLYVAGCATFPTCGQANPTLTIVAMALRLARHVEASL